MAEQPDLAAAALLGLSGGMRTFAPAVTLALAGRTPLRGRARQALVLAAASELIADKLPATPSRWSLAGLAPRIALSGAGGHQLAGIRGAVTAATAAVAAAFAGSHARIAIDGGCSQLLAASAEDALSYTLATIAVQSS